MSIATLFASKKENDLFKTCHYLLKKLQVNVTHTGLSETLQRHVEYPSLLAIKDTLFEYGIESGAIEKGVHSYDAFETPFICSIQQEGWPIACFTLVTSTTAEHIEYLDPITEKPISIPVADFEQIDKHIILLLDTTAPRDEAHFVENSKKQRNHMLTKRVPVFLVLAAILLAGGYILSQPVGMQTWYGLGYLLSAFLGLVVSSLLIWNEIDAHNPFIKEVCGGKSKKLSCNAVLSSSKASLMGISWSVWGFTFFATFFTTQVLFPANTSFMLMWSVLSLLVAPYILFSIYYQWKVVRQWCPLCLAVQAVLAVNALMAVGCLPGTPAFITAIAPYTMAAILFTGLFFLLLTNMAIPQLKDARDGKSYEKRWKKLRYNPEIFQALLDKSDRVTIPVDHLGIVVGNPQATHEIIKVCNPYCGPCSKVHPELEHIIKTNPDVRIRIIFTATGEDTDKRTPPVAHLLAIQQKYGHEKVQLALDDWYLAPHKDYEAFAQKYPMNGELQEQQEKIFAMRDWCNDMKIRATPTIYINGRELPDSYRVNELRNFF
ncbi:vitamin K epoxide reductase family protein [Chitinophaga nivalis]|uniref:Thioredoxin domain-containing protein n=1 Tax=Chitinophaga nivalis TaxID=2991709 RepID=A0ABT3IH81_9BACT|nr:vitamin K epoxide reductase family protein [Chitinophaga nivalis]MCW3467002.1 thioredoxin domain-containing protein [Chitinophaga nivalis]MCW3483307.1 thioredoxin domain-containing protein [Chitinophaga nivalis]